MLVEVVGLLEAARRLSARAVNAAMTATYWSVGRRGPIHERAMLARTNPRSFPWSHYVRLLGVREPAGRAFYEAEALRGGWTVRQLDRQIQSQFYERTALSRNKAAMLTKGAASRPEDAITPEDEVKDPFVLEFLDLKDDYSESDLEEALILRLEHFLLELERSRRDLERGRK